MTVYNTVEPESKEGAEGAESQESRLYPAIKVVLVSLVCGHMLREMNSSKEKVLLGAIPNVVAFVCSWSIS